MTTLDKLNENLKIAISNKNDYAIEKINKIIKKYNEETYIPNVVISKPCVHRGKLIYEKSCKCASGRIWECSQLGQVLETLCCKEKCNKYE